ncbi:complement C1q-like protein 4 [Alosa pseudoharengus]|uniref:complement C1q-like protein 4 n=1 Tax=Alosa pseudoharengus TaxID=34774 RepID=UPI003F8927E1
MERAAAMLGLIMALMSECSGQCLDSSTVNIYTELKELRLMVGELTGRLDATQKELEQERAAKRVAFTASMLSSEDRNHGPFDRETNLIFEKVITNVGNAYNANTGVFTAPVKGLYYFRYSGRATSSKDMGLSIFKGSSRIVSSYDHHSGDTNDSISNGVALELDIADVVYMRLWINSWIFVDRRYNYCTFSGFLVSPM